MKETSWTVNLGESKQKLRVICSFSREGTMNTAGNVGTGLQSSGNNGGKKYTKILTSVALFNGQRKCKAQEKAEYFTGLSGRPESSRSARPGREHTAVFVLLGTNAPPSHGLGFSASPMALYQPILSK